MAQRPVIIVFVGQAIDCGRCIGLVRSATRQGGVQNTDVEQAGERFGIVGSKVRPYGPGCETLPVDFHAQRFDDFSRWAICRKAENVLGQRH